MYIGVQELSDVTLDAIVADLTFDITHLADFEKAAFVSDSTLASLSSMAAGLVPILGNRLVVAGLERASQTMDRTSTETGDSRGIWVTELQRSLLQ